MARVQAGSGVRALAAGLWIAALAISAAGPVALAGEIPEAPGPAAPDPGSPTPPPAAAPGAQTGEEAAPAAVVGALVEALKLPENFEILAEEAVAYGEKLRADLLPQEDAALWAREVRRLNDPARLRALFEPAFTAAVSGGEGARMLALARDPLMVRALDLELSARRAMLDPAIEEAAMARAAAAQDDPRFASVEAHVAALDLVERNVQTALNANLAFFRAMVAGGAYPYEVSEQEMLADVTAQAGEIRGEMAEWILSYLFLAYAPLSAGDEARLLDLSVRPESLALNDALFAGFEAVFTRTSADLGALVAGRLAGEEL